MNSRWTCFTKTKPIRALTHIYIQANHNKKRPTFVLRKPCKHRWGCWESRDHAVKMDTHTHTHTHFSVSLRVVSVCMRWRAVFLKAEIDSIPSPKSLYFYTIKLPVFPLFYHLLNIFYSNSIEFVHPLPFHYFPLIFCSNFCSNSFPPILFSQKSRKLTCEYPDNVTPLFLTFALLDTLSRCMTNSSNPRCAVTHSDWLRSEFISVMS